uniref:Solute carrier organic anion transporter family member n=1 Tax=Panagrellus redivivus TaxID=6233 RepID=A0A7E4V5K6_PANRE
MALAFDRLTLFLALFALVYFLEAIGGSYLVSAVQNIERQFQIPSKLSGFIVSGSDLSYVPTVIFISYFGGRGNRAKWIGAGCVVIALAHIMTASPNFLFPVNPPELNLTNIEAQLTPDDSLLQEDAPLEALLGFQPIKDRIPTKIREALITKLSGHSLAPRTPELLNGFEVRNHTESLYAIDEPLISTIMTEANSILVGDESDDSELRRHLRQYVQNRANRHDKDLKIIRRAAIAPFAFCGQLVNEVRESVKQLKCNRNHGNFAPLAVIFIALLALGVGRTMPWSLGVPLIDDNVKRKSMPVYFAGISFIRILGPIAGFLIGSFCNMFYYTSPTPPGLTSKDPTWIGAWWLGFLMIGSCTIIPSCALFFFPAGKTKIAPSENGNVDATKKRQSLRLFDKHMDKGNAYGVNDDGSAQTIKEKFFTFLQSYKQVLSSKIYCGSAAGRVCDILAFRGYLVFLPKYLENHYGLPQYRVQIYMAMFGVFGFALGTITGGLIVRKLKLSGRRAAMMVLIVSVINAALYFSKGFLGCHSIVNGIGRDGIATNFNYTNACNAGCGCESSKLFPVCDSTGAAFYSPCHAGCRHVAVNDLTTYELEFADCECATGGIVKKEFCQDNCKYMTYVFFATVISGSFAGGMGVVPGMLILLRSVPPTLRSISLGLQGFMVSLCGTLPSTILWGVVVDSACLVWEKSCGRIGACTIYDPEKLRFRMHTTYALIRIISCLTDLYVWYHAEGLNILDEEDEDKPQSEVEKTEKATADAIEHIPMVTIDQKTSPRP